MDKKILLIAFHFPGSSAVRILGSYLKKRYKISYLFFLENYLWFSEDENFKKKDKNKLLNFFSKFDYVLISATSYEESIVSSIIAMIKKEYPEKKIIIGGIFAIIETEKCLKLADYVCCWTPQTIIDFFEYLEGGKLENNTLINFKGRDKSIKTILKSPKTYDELPLPDYTKKKNYFYIRGKLFLNETYDFRSIYFETISGCYYNCSFCSNSYINKIKIENKMPFIIKSSLKRLLKQIKYFKKIISPITLIGISDDDFFLYSTEELREFVKEYNKYINKPLIINVDPRSIKFKEKIKIISKINSKIVVFLGVQTGSEKFNKKVYNRNQKNKLIIDLHNYIKEKIKNPNFQIGYQIIYANPYETKEDVIETINLMLNLRGAHYHLNAFFPLAGTPLAKELKKYYKINYNFWIPKYSMYKRHGVYYSIIFLIYRLNIWKLEFLLPYRFKPNFLTEFINKIGIISKSSHWQLKRNSKKFIKNYQKEIISTLNTK